MTSTVYMNVVKLMILIIYWHRSRSLELSTRGLLVDKYALRPKTEVHMHHQKSQSASAKPVETSTCSYVCPISARVTYILFTSFPVYIDASDSCNELAFQLGNAAAQGSTLSTRQWSIKVKKINYSHSRIKG